jgi:hypothetical protein
MATEMKTTISTEIAVGMTVSFEFTRFVEDAEDVREAAEIDKGLVDAYVEGYAAAA